MGRYDKIRYYNGSSWKKPSKIKVWDGLMWVDYGADDSSNTKSIYGVYNNDWKRFTLNKVAKERVADKYLEMNGEAGINMGTLYQFYKFHFEIEVEFTSATNQMLFEAYIDDTHYARVGFYYSSDTWYIYYKAQYGDYVAELNTLYATNKESIKLNTKYKVIIDNTDGNMNGTVTNMSSGLSMTLLTSGGASQYSIGGFYAYSNCRTVLFGGSYITGRPMNAKIYSCKIQSYGTSTTINGATYDMMNAPTGGTTLIGTNLLGGGQGTITHNGTLKEEKETYYVWE